MGLTLDEIAEALKSLGDRDWHLIACRLQDGATEAGDAGDDGPMDEQMEEEDRSGPSLRRLRLLKQPLKKTGVLVVKITIQVN